MIDYLCLKLGWTTAQVLDNPQFDNERKMQFYSIKDEIEKARPIAVIPLGFDKGGVTREVQKRYGDLLVELQNFINLGHVEDKKLDEAKELEKMLGGTKAGIEDFFRKVTNNQIPMKRINSSRAM